MNLFKNPERLFRNFVLGKENFIPSYSAYKRALSIGYLSVIGLITGCLYLILDLSRQRPDSLGRYIIIIFTSAISIILIRRGYHKPAITVYLLMVNTMMLYFALFGSRHTDVQLFFISNSLAALAFYEYSERLKAFFFVLLGLVLYAVSYFNPFSVAHEQYDVSQIVNFLVVYAICVFIFYAVIKLNHYSEMRVKEKNEELRKVNNELDRFVYSASHQLRAPLASVLGLIEIAHKSKTQEDISQCLTLMKTRINNLDEVIKGIINYSRNVRLDIIREPVVISGLLQEVVQDLKHSEDRDNLCVNNNISPDLTIISDPERLKLVFHNLIENSFQYQDQNKESQIIVLDAGTNTDHIWITIKDNGDGISREHHAKVFDMFYRASEKSKGAGLGLFIVKETLFRLSGTIHLQSSPGEGAAFTVKLPVVS